jgi:hypothetical protein
LLREAQGDLTAFKKGLRYMIDYANFLKNSLFCEWGYVINLDTNQLEVYRGFQKKPNDNRYVVSKPDDGYYNCALAHTFDIEFLQGIKTNERMKMVIDTLENLCDLKCGE